MSAHFSTAFCDSGRSAVLHIKLENNDHLVRDEGLNLSSTSLNPILALHHIQYRGQDGDALQEKDGDPPSAFVAKLSEVWGSALYYHVVKS